MGPTFILVLSILTNAGVLEMTATTVPNCDGKEEFQQMMQEQVEAGAIKDWNAVCVTVGEHGQEV